MKIKVMKKGRTVDGDSYVEEDEEYDKKRKNKMLRNMSTAGISLNLKKSEDKQGYSNKPRVKPQKKNAKPVSGQGKI